MSKKSKDFSALASAAFGNLPVAEPEIHDLDPRRKILSDTKKQSDIRLVPIGKIKPDPHQPRKSMNPETINGLAQSIKEHGILQPLTVEYQPKDDVYLIRLGQRRYTASLQLGLSELPCIIQEATDDISKFEHQLIENIQREDFNPLDKARGLLELKTKLGNPAWSIVEEKMGISESRRKQFIRLLDLPEFIQKEVVSVGGKSVANVITEKHARALKVLNRHPESQMKLFKLIKEGKTPLSGDQAMELAHEYLEPTLIKKQTLVIDYRDTADLITKLTTELNRLKKLGVTGK